MKDKIQCFRSETLEEKQGGKSVENKCNMTREQNIFLAKKEIVETIYNAIKLEGCNTTFPQTKKILDGINDSAVPLDDVQIILNLKNAWQYILQNLDKEIDLQFICNINLRVSKNESLDPGVIRYGNVGVTLKDGSKYYPDLPDIEKLKEKLKEIGKIENTTERALKYYLWGMRSQLFWDGNKRTSNIVANSILIREGKGIITIQPKDLDEFNDKLSKFYITNDFKEMTKFLYDKCIKGIEIDKELEKKNKEIFEKEVRSRSRVDNRGNER